MTVQVRASQSSGGFWKPAVEGAGSDGEAADVVTDVLREEYLEGIRSVMADCFASDDIV